MALLQVTAAKVKVTAFPCCALHVKVSIFPTRCVHCVPMRPAHYNKTTFKVAAMKARNLNVSKSKHINPHYCMLTA